MKFVFAFVICLYGVVCTVFAQEGIELTLRQTIDMAWSNSPEARAARHTYLAAYWNYKFYKANYLPSVALSSTSELNRQINKITQNNGSEAFLRQNQLNTELNLSINQNIWFTGGKVLVASSAKRLDALGSHAAMAYNTNPITVGYTQSLLGYNALKWERRIEPLVYQEARKTYAEALELVASRASSLFFNLAVAQTNLDIAAYNYASADTLYRYARGRYNIGTITENEMLQLEVNKLTEETNLMDARIEVEERIQSLLFFLGVEKETSIRVVPDSRITVVEIPEAKALELAFQNSPEPDSHERQILNSRSNLAQAKANTGLKADLYLQFGLSQTAENIEDSYKKPLDQQYVSIGLSLPILDWGRAKGRVKVAQSQLELTRMQVERNKRDFEQNVCKMVRQFNLQSHRVAIAARTDSTARLRNEVARRLYLSGKSTILDLNLAVTEKDAARRNHIHALSTYWSLYYGIRSMTQYDFEKQCLIEYSLPEK